MFFPEGFDSYCTHPDCLASSDIFFNYSPDNPHVVGHDALTEPIHARNLQKVMREGGEEGERKFREGFERMVQERVGSSVEGVSQRIAEFVKGKYLAVFGEEVKRKMKGGQAKQPKQILEQLKAGNITILRHILEYRRSEREMSFINYLQLQETESIETEIARSLTQLGDKIVEILDVAFEDPNMILNLEEQYTNATRNITPESCMRVRKRKSEGGNMCEESLEEVSDPPNSKTKIIAKARTKVQARKGKQKTQQKPKEKQIDLSVTKQLDSSEEIRLISPTEIMVLKCTNPQKTFTHILQYKNLTSFHIFASKFADRDTIRRLFKAYPIERITFNCNHEFEDSFLRELREDQLDRLKCLQLKWGIDIFFDEYHLMRQFPEKCLNSTERVKSLKTVFNRLNLLNNQTLWIDSDQIAGELKVRPFFLKNLKVLHVASTEGEKSVSLKTIDFPTLTNLTTLNLNGVSFVGENGFERLINTNPGLTNIIIHHCWYITTVNVNQILANLRRLPALTHFSFIPRISSVVVSPENITALTNLQSLHLGNVNFFYSGDYTDSSYLREFNNLKKLRSLSLYACDFIYSDFFKYLDESVLENLTILNIGLTRIDNLSVEYLLKMRNLEYLNIDELEFAGAIFIELCKLYRERYAKEWGLRYLSIEEIGQFPMDRFSLDAMREIGGYLPKLEYIYIANCKGLKDYDFKEFKALRTVALNRPLYQSFAKPADHLNWHVFD